MIQKLEVVLRDYFADVERNFITIAAGENYTDLQKLEKERTDLQELCVMMDGELRSFERKVLAAKLTTEI